MKQRRKVFLGVAVSFVVASIFLALLSIFTKENGRWNFLYDNIFWSQTLLIFGLFLTVRYLTKNKRLEKSLLAVLLITALFLPTAYILAKHGPRVVTESDHPLGIRYLCYYYGDDVPILQNQDALCFIKNSVTSASNPAWLLQDYYGFKHRDNERSSQILTFMVLEGILITSFFLVYYKKKLLQISRN